jgi:hypothetical protein
VTPAQLAVVTFVPRADGLDIAARNAVTQRMVERLLADGYAMLTSTAVRDLTVLRLCLIHPAASLDEVLTTLDRLAAYAVEAIPRVERR